MFIFAASIVAVLASGIASIAGFGIGSLMTSLVATRYGMKTAVAAVAVPHLIAMDLRFWRLRRDLDRRVLLGFGAMNAAGSLAGALLDVWVDSPVLSIVLGILLLFSGIAVSSWRSIARIRRADVSVRRHPGSQAMLALAFKAGPSWRQRQRSALWSTSVRMPVYLITGSGQMLRAWPAVVTLRSVWSSGHFWASAFFERSPRGHSAAWLLLSYFGVGGCLLLTPRR
jgi:uncharacterized membrane protein YfcA